MEILLKTPDQVTDSSNRLRRSMFDMVFNLGITKLKSQYIKFNGFIKSEKWDDAAKQSNRTGISPARNKYVFDLLKAANKKAKTP